jgi:hypothetical protein
LLIHSLSYIVSHAPKRTTDREPCATRRNCMGVNIWGKRQVAHTPAKSLQNRISLHKFTIREIF